MTLWYPVMHPTQFLIYGYRNVCWVVMSQLNKLNMCLCGDVCVVECHVEWCTYAELLWSCVHMLMPFSTSVIKMTTFLVGKHNFFPGAIVQFVPLKYIFYTMGYGLLVVFAACWGVWSHGGYCAGLRQSCGFASRLLYLIFKFVTHVSFFCYISLST